MDRLAQDALYAEANFAYGATIRRLARGYEADPERRRDLLQDIHLELWRSLKSFDGRCSLQTWVYRVSHNVGVSHMLRSRRVSAPLRSLDPVEATGSRVEGEKQANQRVAAERILALIHQLKLPDRQVMLLYLEGEPAVFIAEVTGLSPANVATKIHRIKNLLQQQYLEGVADAKV